MNTQDHDVKSSKFFLFLASSILLLVAASLRYIGCFSFPYDGDETFSMQRSSEYAEFWKTGNFDLVKYVQVNPLFAATSFLLPYFKTPEAAVRTLPLLAGIAFFPIFLWLIGKRFGMIVALSSLSILAFNPTHIFFSQYGRYYSVIFLFANLAIFCFLRSYETRSFKLFLTSMLFAILAFLEQPGTAMIFPAEVAFLSLILLWKWRDENKLYATGDYYMARVWMTFALAFIPVAIYSVVVLLGWKTTTIGKLTYSITGYLAGVFMRLGAPITIFSAISSCYFILRGDITGIFLTLATFSPIVAGAILSMLGMEVNPYYVAYVIFPAILLCCTFLCKVISTNVSSEPPEGKRPYELALIAATTVVMICGSVTELASHYIDGGRHNWPATVQWIDKARGDDGTIVIGLSRGFLVDYCKRYGIAHEALDLEAPLTDVEEALADGKTVIMPYGWWLTLSDEDIDRLLQTSHSLILNAERDGLTPKIPQKIRIESYGAKSVSTDRNLTELLKTKYELKHRVGKTRLDYRQNYLLIYGPRIPPPATNP